MTCKKCGSRYISGPKFHNNGYVDSLEYRCLICEYAWDTPTLAGLPEHLQPTGGTKL